jgi:hypothetical protein
VTTPGQRSQRLRTCGQTFGNRMCALVAACSACAVIWWSLHASVMWLSLIPQPASDSRSAQRGSQQPAPQKSHLGPCGSIACWSAAKRQLCSIAGVDLLCIMPHAGPVACGDWRATGSSLQLQCAPRSRRQRIAAPGGVSAGISCRRDACAHFNHRFPGARGCGAAGASRARRGKQRHAAAVGVPPGTAVAPQPAAAVPAGAVRRLGAR